MYDLPLPHIVTLNQGWKRHLLLLQIGRFLGNESNPAWCHRYERNLQVRPSPWSAHQQWNELSGLHQCDPSTQPEILPNSVRPKAYKLCLGFQLQRHDHQGAKLMQKNSQDAPLELLWPANIMCTCKPCLLDITKKQQGLNLQWTYQVVFWTAGLLFSALHRFLDSRLSISTSTSITTLWCTRRWLLASQLLYLATLTVSQKPIRIIAHHYHCLAIRTHRCMLHHKSRRWIKFSGLVLKTEWIHQ